MLQRQQPLETPRTTCRAPGHVSTRSWVLRLGIRLTETHELQVELYAESMEEKGHLSMTRLVRWLGLHFNPECQLDQFPFCLHPKLVQ